MTLSNNIWDNYRPGKMNDIGIRVVVLLDESGSLKARAGNEVIRMGHAIKRAMDEIGAPCSVYLFAAKTRMMYAADDIADELCPENLCLLGGSTKVDEAHELAARDLAFAPEHYKVLFTLTDGGFTGDFQTNREAYNNRMNLIHSLGVSSHLFLYNYSPANVEREKESRLYQHATAINRPVDMATYVHEFLLDRIKAEMGVE